MPPFFTPFGMNIYLAKVNTIRLQNQKVNYYKSENVLPIWTRKFGEGFSLKIFDFDVNNSGVTNDFRLNENALEY